MEEDAGEERTGEVKIWKGKLKLNGPRKTEGAEVDAKIAIGDSGAIMFEIGPKDAEGVAYWRTCDSDEIYAPSWLRALAETGQEVP